MGNADRTGSLVYVAESPVTFLQTLGGDCVPETKFTAAH